MAEILKVELQDENGNTYYLKTDSSSVYCTDGSTVETKLNAKIDTSNIVQNTDTSDYSKIPSSAVTAWLQAQINNIISTLLPNKVDRNAVVSHLKVAAEQFPGIDFAINDVVQSSIFDYGNNLALRQYLNDSSYKEITVPQLLSINENVSNLNTDVSNLTNNIGKALLYKGAITDGLLQTVDTGIFHYDGGSSANVPVNTGTGVIYSFNMETVLCYRLCITSADGVWYSVYIPGQTYGTWKRLKEV